jgi:hypothetical protein
MTKLGRLRSGEVVHDAEPSHLLDHPDVADVLAEALGLVDADGADFVATVDLGRTVGLSHCVETCSDDLVVWAFRGDRDWPTRFAPGRMPAETGLVTVVLVLREDAAYTLLTAFCGPAAPPEPGDPRATSESKDFWGRHALTLVSRP